MLLGKFALILKQLHHLEKLCLVDLEQDLFDDAALVSTAKKLGKLLDLPDLFSFQLFI